MNKHTIRKHIKEKRLKLKSTEVKLISDKVINQLVKTFDFRGKLTNLFLPIDEFNEINLYPLIENITLVGGKICVNKSDFLNILITPYFYTEKDQIEINSKGIPEPLFGEVVNITDIDFVIVPLMAFNSEGYRVGYGKGFYDKFLSKCNTNSIFIGVNHFGQSSTINDIDSQDVPLHFVITPEKVYKF